MTSNRHVPVPRPPHSRSLLPNGTPKPPKTDAGRADSGAVPRTATTAPHVEAPKPVHRSRRLRARDRAPWPRAAAERAEGTRQGESGGGARFARRPPLMAQPQTLGRKRLAHRVRPRRDHRLRDDGPREPVVHARLLRA